MEHSEFEKNLVEMLLAGDDPVLDGLRQQYVNAAVRSREFTGAGFYTNFDVNKAVAPVAKGKSFRIGDIDGAFGDIAYALGFILFVEKGYLSMIEGYTLSADTWPSDYSDVALTYDGPDERRDFEKLKAQWA